MIRRIRMKTKTYQQELYEACKEHNFRAQQALDRYAAAKTDQERECAKTDNLQHLAAYHALQWALDKTIDIKQEIKQAKLNILGEMWARISHNKTLIESHIADGSFTIEDIYMEIDELMAEVQNET